MVSSKKKSKSGDNINAALALMAKTGKYCLGTKQTMKSLRSGTAKLVLISNNCPKLKKSEIEYYAMLARCPVHHFNGNNIALGTACGKYFRVSMLAVSHCGGSEVLAGLCRKE
eukprot:g1123.t1